MQKMRIYEIAKQAKMSTKELMNILEQLDIKAKSHMSNLENNELNLVLEYLNLDNLIEKNPKENGLEVKIQKEEQNNIQNQSIRDLEDNNVDIVKVKENNSTKSKEKKKNKKNKKKEKHGVDDIKVEKDYRIGETIVVKELADLLDKGASQIISKLITLGIMANQNQSISYDYASLVAKEFGIDLMLKEDVVSEDDPFGLDFEDDEADLVSRPPVVTVMGHVDHGKTSLLDAIRNTNVTKREAGGITQHIGAYTVSIDNKKIVFLDTPGHEAFTAMRSRGAMVTDIAVLVVAADDGVMPQTVEAINHAKAAGVPIIVAINKMDKPEANIDRVRQELMEYDLVAEEWGGDTINVGVSAKKGQGIDELLEMILMVAEMEELKANPNRYAVGTIIEAQLDKGRGPVATVLIQKGTLKAGDMVVSGTTSGRVRAMFDDKAKKINKARPSTPVVILGLSDVPEAGDLIFAVKDEKTARGIADAQKNKEREDMIQTTQKVSLEDLFNKIQEGNLKDLNIVIKTDVRGTIDAVKQSFEKLSNDEVRVNIIHGAVGGITESDVMLASASNAVIIGFNVRPTQVAIDMSKSENVDMRTYRVIYDAINDIKAAIDGMLEPEYKEEILGRAEVRQVFKVPNIGSVAGVYVKSGVIQRNEKVRLIRNDVVLYEGAVSSLKRFKDDARELQTNFEGGIGLENYNDIKVGDEIEAFTMKEIK